jgi:hypothetical protein
LICSQWLASWQLQALDIELTLATVDQDAISVSA